MISTRRLALGFAALVACGGTADIDAPSGSGGAGGNGGAPGQAGDACTLESCDEGLFCNFPDDRCGQNGVSGVCTEPSMGASTESPTTICGCDGNIYSFWFVHEMAGYDAGSLELCEPPAGKVHCGGLLCDDDGMTFCSYPNIDCFDSEGATCQTLPAECVGASDCGCFGQSAIFCELREDGIFEHACF
jgi:hypothetical protein